MRKTVTTLLSLLVLSSACFPSTGQTSELKFEGPQFIVHCPPSYGNGKDMLEFLENHHKYFLEFFLFGMPKIPVTVIEGLYSSKGYAGKAYYLDCRIEVDARSWTGSPIRATLLHELTHLWTSPRYKPAAWFSEGFATLMPVVIFNITRNVADKTMYERVIAGNPKHSVTDRAYTYDILYGYTKSYGADWIKRFLRFLKSDYDNNIARARGGNYLGTDSSIVGYLSAAIGKDLSDYYVKEGLTIDRQTVDEILKRHVSGLTDTLRTATGSVHLSSDSSLAMATAIAIILVLFFASFFMKRKRFSQGGHNHS